MPCNTSSHAEYGNAPPIVTQSMLFHNAQDSRLVEPAGGGNTASERGRLQVVTVISVLAPQDQRLLDFKISTGYLFVLHYLETAYSCALSTSARY